MLFRSLWWGHRIPAYYYPAPVSDASPSEEKFVVAETAEEALDLARKESGNSNLQLSDLRQDEDALDTWFSSWLWPVSLFDGIRNPGNEEINYYYPTSDLVTAPDIIFFWVARMIMAGEEYMGKFPFKNVYFTGIVRDKLGRKMSKSLGNSPDPIELIEKFGADGVRMGMMLSAPAGNDILFDEALCEQGHNFNNKIWNAFRLVKGWQVTEATVPGGSPSEATVPAGSPSGKRTAVAWMDAKLRQADAELKDHFSKYRISDALMTVYKLFWDEFSQWYLEMIKPAYIDGQQQPLDRETYDATLRFFETLLKMLHPFMPFITEELWQALYDRGNADAPSATDAGEGTCAPSIMREHLVLGGLTAEDEQLIADIEQVKQVVGGVRTVRSQKNIAPKEKLELQAVGQNRFERYSDIITKMAGLSGIEVVEQKDATASAFMVGTDEFAVPLGSLIDVKAEIEKMEAQLKHLEGFLAGVQKKLSNERFVANAPEAVVALERKKQSDAEEKIASLRESLAALKK